MAICDASVYKIYSLVNSGKTSLVDEVKGGFNSINSTNPFVICCESEERSNFCCILWDWKCFLASILNVSTDMPSFVNTCPKHVTPLVARKATFRWF